MTIQSFSVGQVLTAAQVNALQANDYNQTVSNKTASYTLVAADKGTRIAMSSTSATTITVNTGLFSAGDTLFIQNLNTGVSTITAGTATVTTSASLALAQWEGGTLYFTSASAAIFFKSDGASAAGGGMTQIATGNLSGTSTTISSISGSYKNLILFVRDWYPATNDNYLAFRFNSNSSGTNYGWAMTRTGFSNNVTNSFAANEIHINDGANGQASSDNNNFCQLTVYDYANTNTTKVAQINANFYAAVESVYRAIGGVAAWKATPAAITEINMIVIGGASFSGGTYELYGVN